MTMKKGTHILLEMYGVEKKYLDDILFIKKVFRKAIKESGLIEIKGKFVYHKFKPHGLTAVTLLTTSHIALHTWPEKNYLALDIFACTDEEKVMKAMDIMIKEFKPKRVKKEIKKRGYVLK